MTMAYGYFKENDTEKKVAFDVFYRRNQMAADFYFAGLEQVIEYLEICILRMRMLNTSVH